MKLIRFLLGSLILFWDRVFAPIPLQRDPALQAQVDRETAPLTLYQFESCPFCVKVRRQIRRLVLRVETKDVLKDKAAEAELLQGGGERQTPCLRISQDGVVQWMYESSDINQYLQDRFGLKEIS